MIMKFIFSLYKCKTIFVYIFISINFNLVFSLLVLNIEYVRRIRSSMRNLFGRKLMSRSVI